MREGANGKWSGKVHGGRIRLDGCSLDQAMTVHRLRGVRNGSSGMLSACLSLVIAASCVGHGCPPGYAMDDHGQCRQCAPGTYKSMQGTSACLLCPYATFSNATGASSAGMCTPCPLWHFADQGSRDATSCIAPLASNNRTPSEPPVCMPASPDCLTDQGRNSRKSAAQNLVPTSLVADSCTNCTRLRGGRESW